MYAVIDELYYASAVWNQYHFITTLLRQQTGSESTPSFNTADAAASVPRPDSPAFKELL